MWPEPQGREDSKPVLWVDARFLICETKTVRKVKFSLFPPTAPSRGGVHPETELLSKPVLIFSGTAGATGASIKRTPMPPSKPMSQPTTSQPTTPTGVQISIAADVALPGLALILRGCGAIILALILWSKCG
jgi:hypothetical protein